MVLGNFKGSMKDIVGWVAFCCGNILFWIFFAGGLLFLRLMDVPFHKSVMLSLAVFTPFMYFRSKINKTHDFLTGIDADLYDIKKHLGIDTRPRTETQFENKKIFYLQELVRSSATFDEVRDQFIALYGFRHWGRQCIFAEHLFREKIKNDPQKT